MSCFDFFTNCGSSARWPPEVNEFQGRIVQGMQLLDEIGRGTFSVVYRALTRNGVVAAKLRNARDRGQEVQSLGRIRQAAATLGLSSAMLPTCVVWTSHHRLGRYACCIETQTPCGQGDLYAGAERGVPPWRLLCGLRDAASALAFLHALNWVHRDVKLENIIMCGDRGVLIDYDFAAPGGVMRRACGTWIYAAPEVKRAFKTATRLVLVMPASDVWAVGIVMRQLGSLCGKGTSELIEERVASFVCCKDWGARVGSAALVSLLDLVINSERRAIA
jgi:serine/threonine protein kinase